MKLQSQVEELSTSVKLQAEQLADQQSMFESTIVVKDEIIVNLTNKVVTSTFVVFVVDVLILKSVKLWYKTKLSGF